MKTLFSICLACVAFSVSAASTTPLNRAFLQSNMDGNGFDITNLFILRAGTVIGGQLVGGGAGLSNVVASAVMPGISLTNVTIKGGTLYGDGSGLSNVIATGASSLAAGSSLTNVTIKGGSIYADGAGISNVVAASVAVGTSLTNVTIQSGNGVGLTNVPASSSFYNTNLGTPVVTFGGFVEYRDFGTNASFAFSGFSGVSSSNVQTVVYLVTNSTAAVWDVIPPPGMLATNGTWKTTNVTAFTFVNNGKKWTNGTAYPIK